MAVTPKTERLIPIGISACLLGQAVRYNGGHKYDEYSARVLGRYFSFTPLCPEVAIGMGVPREPIRLVGHPGSSRALGAVRPELDVTQSLQNYADSVGSRISQVRGYIFMQGSPSCGLYSTKTYSPAGDLLGMGEGVFAGRLCMRFPLLPVEESARLDDPELRENFVARIYMFDEWMQLAESGITPHGLVQFHSRYKYFVMSFSQRLYRELGALVAKSGLDDLQNVAHDYITRLMLGTLKPPTRKGHVNVLYHLVGYLRERVPDVVRQELTDAIEQYRLGRVSLSMPVILLRNYLESCCGDYMRQQAYLAPYPDELGLRDRI